MKWIMSAAGALLLAVLTWTVAAADGGPHGGYRDITSGLPSACAACHRVHQGKSTGKLLKAESPYALCLTCHNGAGSRLDVLDGVKLAAVIGPDAGVIRAANTLELNLSVAPSASLYADAGGTTEFTIAVRNRTASPATVTLAIISETNIDTVGTSTDDANTFLAATLVDTSLIVPAMAGDVPGVAYTQLKTVSESGAAANDQTLTSVRATFNGNNATVVAQTRIGAADSNILNGGGFRYMGGEKVTSRHNADPADNSLNPWGFNANTGQNTNALSAPLQCTSCHNPHGTANYRLLKEKVNSQTVVVRAYTEGGFVKDENNVRGLESGVPADKYTKAYYGSAGSGGAPTTAGQGSLSSLCGACHTAYPSSGASLGYTAGGTTHYRHKTEMPYTDWTNPETGTSVTNNPETNPIANSGGAGNFPALRLASMSGAADGSNDVVTCLTCHRVHGSSSQMTNYALMAQFGGLGDNDLTPSQTAAAAAADGRTGNSNSTLLYTDNRGMCEACHQW